MRRLLLSSVLALGGAAGLVLAPAVAQPYRTSGVIFVADEAGDSNTLTENLRMVLSNTRSCLRIDATRWTSYGGFCQDYAYVTGHRKSGACMAARVQALHHHCPEARIYLMGHGSGAHVVLSAAEILPPHSIDRIVLLSPSVSSTYDLRQAIRATQAGIDVYYSCDDGKLEAFGEARGTADGIQCVAPAGLKGFCRPPLEVPDAQLYGLVRQYPFDPDLYAGTGNQGGHWGTARVNFLRLVVLPNMFTLPH